MKNLFFLCQNELHQNLGSGSRFTNKLLLISIQRLKSLRFFFNISLSITHTHTAQVSPTKSKEKSIIFVCLNSFIERGYLMTNDRHRIRMPMSTVTSTTSNLNLYDKKRKNNNKLICEPQHIQRHTTNSMK